MESKKTLKVVGVNEAGEVEAWAWSVELGERCVAGTAGSHDRAAAMADAVAFMEEAKQKLGEVQ